MQDNSVISFFFLFKGSRVGRQPNAIKYYCVREISQREQNSELPSPDDNPNASSNRPGRNHVDTSSRSAVKRGINDLECSNSGVVPTVLITGEFVSSGEGGGIRSRASTLSASSGVTSTSAAFQNPLEPSQNSPIVTSASLHKGLKMEDVAEFGTGTDMVDSSFSQQLASVTAANSFANHFLL